MFAKCAVSVGIQYIEGGAARLWLCKESGGVPVCKEKACEGFRLERGEKRACVVFQTTGFNVRREYRSAVFFGKMSAEGVGGIAKQVFVELEGSRDSSPLIRLSKRRIDREFFERFENWKLHDAPRTGHLGEENGAKEVPVLLVSRGFNRLYPYGKGHWFTGVTDALGFCCQGWWKRKGMCSNPRCPNRM